MKVVVREMAKYRAGVCNIGTGNRLARAAYGVLLLAVTIGAWLWMRDNMERMYRLVLFLPLYAGFLGIYQAYYGFCVYHAWRRSFDMR